MSAQFLDGAEVELRLPKLAKRVQEMAKGSCNWVQVAAAAHEEFVAPLQILGFAALERATAVEPFRTVLSHKLPFLPVGRFGPRSTIACFVEAVASPGQVVVTDDVPGFCSLACAALISDSGSQQIVVLTGSAPSVTKDQLRQAVRHLLELVRPAAGGVAARKPADAVSIAIRRAKREWEAVADGLPAMVGLADASGNVLRVNRSWTRVPGKGLGGSIHSLVHEGCKAPDCPFAQSLSSALALLPSRRKLVIRSYLKERDADLTVHLRHVPVRAGRGARVVFSISESRVSDGSLRQSLLSAKRGIDAALDALRRHGDSSALQDLERSSALIQGLVQDAQGITNRRLVFDPGQSGLGKALRAQCAEWMATRGGRAQVHCIADDRNVPKSLWLTIHRIVHEALYNLGGPSPSGTLGITLVPGDQALLLAILRAGEGQVVDRHALAKSPAILVMRELVESSGGTFYCNAAADGSVTVEVHWSRSTDFSPRVFVPSPVH